MNIFFFFLVYVSKMDQFNKTVQCCNCFKRNLNKTSEQIKIINSASEVENVRDQLNIDHVGIGFILATNVGNLYILVHENL